MVESTRDRKPQRLVYYEVCLDQNGATKREYWQLEERVLQPAKPINFENLQFPMATIFGSKKDDIGPENENTYFGDVNI